MNTVLATPQPFYRRPLLILAAVMLAISGIYGLIRLRYTFQGVVLPLVAVNSLPHPPPAWLIVDNQAIPATFGNYCWHHPLWGGKCETASKAEAIPDLATVTLPPNHALVIVVDKSDTMVFQPTVRAWNSRLAPGTGRRQGSSGFAGRFSTFTLQPLDQVDNQVLEIEIMLGGTRRATYLWHLKSSAIIDHR